jgi:hypothetical protein
MKKRFLSAVLLGVSVLILATISAAAQAAKTDVTGAWTFTVESGAGTSNPAVTFKQDGEKLTGHYSSQLLGETELTGTVKGQAIEFTVSADVQGFKINLKYTGTLEGKDSMKGTLASEAGDGTFTAKRK